MSGHSKWATIKRQKGVNDAKRGQIFTKLGNAISIAVKQGGGVGDPDMNPTLRLAVDKAKSANMPKENIERSIKRALGAGEGIEFFDALYEGFAPGGVGMLIEAVTDKKQRTVAEVKNVIEKNGGTMAGQGAVGYLFNRAGEIIVSTIGKSSDDILNIAMENNVEDVEEEDGVAFLYTEPADLQTVKTGIEDAGLVIEEASLIYKPINKIPVTDEQLQKVLNIVEKLEDLDDVQKVYTNMA